MSRIKEDFLNNQMENGYSIGATRTIMKKITAFEKAYNKDIEDFNKDDMLYMLLAFTRNSINSISVYLSTIKKYHGYISNYYGIHSLEFVMDMKIGDIRDLFANERINDVITREELMKDIHKIKNAMDRAIILLIFDGVKGDKLSDVLNIKKDDIDFNKKRIHIDNRIYNVSEETIKELREAIDTDIYEMEKSKTGNIRKVELIESEYIFRRSKIVKTKREEAEISPIITHQTAQKRLLKLISTYIEKPNMTLNSIYKSGALHKLLEHSKKEKKMLSNTEVRKWIDNSSYEITKQEIYDLYRKRAI